MCWNIEVSIASCLFGWATCLYLLKRQRSERDSWYALYLLTFTFTQIIDAFLWHLNSKNEMEQGLVACRKFQFQFSAAPTGNGDYLNYAVSKYMIPLVVFSQHATQLMYPSEQYKKNPKAQNRVIAFHAFPCLIMCFCFGCTMLTESNFPYGAETLFWGGNFQEFPQALIQFGATLHSGLVAFGFYYFCNMRGAVLKAHLIPLGCVVAFLWITEGRMDFGSKWCSYCLIYSLVYICEPWWYPNGHDSPAAATKATKSKPKSKPRSKTPVKKKTPVKRKASAKKKTPVKTNTTSRRRSTRTKTPVRPKNVQKFLRQRTPGRTLRSQNEQSY